MSVITSTRIATAGVQLVRLRATAALSPGILAVEFRATDGRAWNAIGSGDTVEAAIDWARESCPDGTTWHTVNWNDLYGD
jgi:hypothetical protein